MKLTVDSTPIPEGVMLVVTGEVDMESSPQLRDEIKRALKAKPAVLKLHLAAVPYIDSSGVAVLIEGMKWTKKKGVGYALVKINDSVRGVLDMSRLLPLFTIEDGDATS